MINNTNKKKHNEMLTYLRKSDIDQSFSIDEDKIIDQIKELPLEESLTALSYIDKLLHIKELNLIEQQITILKLLDPDDKKNYLIYLDQENFNVIFHHQQIFYCMILLIKNCDNVKAKAFTNQHKLNILDSLFCINDILNPDEEDIIKDNDKILGKMWQDLHKESILHQNFTNEISRTYQLFITNDLDKEFMSLFKSLIGIDIKKYMALIISIIFNWFNPGINQNSTILNSEKYFKNIKGLKKKEVIHVLDLLSADLKSFKEKLALDQNGLKNNLVNFKTIFDFPLIKLNKKQYICLSLSHLIHNSTRGISEMLNNMIHKKKREDVTIDLSTYIGKIYEDYIINQLSLLFPNSGKFKRLYTSSKSKEIGDAIIAYPNKLLFIEVKATSIQKNYRLSDKFESIELGLEKFLTKTGMNQINKNINRFINKDTNIDGLSPDEIKEYFPILISCIEDIPNNKVFIKLYSQILKKNDIFINAKINQFFIISLKEFEYILALLQDGKCLIDILRKYISENHTHISFYNFLVITFPLKDSLLPGLLKSSYKEMSKMIEFQLDFKRRKSRWKNLKSIFKSLKELLKIGSVTKTL